MLIGHLMQVAIRVLIAVMAGKPLAAGAQSGMSGRLIGEHSISANSSTFLIRELRESEPISPTKAGIKYAKLMLAAADEIEQLHARIGDLEGAKKPS
jgi:hypothetical protein